MQNSPIWALEEHLFRLVGCGCSWEKDADGEKRESENQDVGESFHDRTSSKDNGAEAHGIKKTERYPIDLIEQPWCTKTTVIVPRNKVPGTQRLPPQPRFSMGGKRLPA
jgi:hypothetical protein